MAQPSTPDLAQLNAWCRNTLGEHLGIELTEVGERTLTGRMPVDHRTLQRGHFQRLSEPWTRRFGFCFPPGRLILIGFQIT